MQRNVILIAANHNRVPEYKAGGYILLSPTMYWVMENKHGLAVNMYSRTVQYID